MREQLGIEHVRLADEDARRVVLLGELPPPPQYVVHLGATGVELLALAAHLHVPVVVGSRGRVVAQLAVLDDRVRDVEAEPGDAAVEPEAQDVVERVAHLLVPPVEVGLRRAGSCSGSTARCARRTSTPARRGSNAVHPVVRRRAVGLRVGPHVPVAVRGRRATNARRGTTGADRSCGSGTRSSTTRMPRRAACSISSSASASVPSAGSTSTVVGDVVAPVVVGRHADRVEPDAVDAEPLEMVEPLDDAAQIADPVAVRVHVGTGIDLVRGRRRATTCGRARPQACRARARTLATTRAQLAAAATSPSPASHSAA